jgi:hypothetical protein
MIFTNKAIAPKIGLIIALIFFSLSAFSQKTIAQVRNIDIAGLVVDAQTLLPVEGAAIYDAQNTVLGTSDAKGYYKIQLTYKQSGQLNFKLTLVKPGFVTFHQHENWADMPGNSKGLFYFGLKKVHGRTASFSTVQHGDLSYDNVDAGFEKVRDERGFYNKLAAAKTGNQKVFLRVDTGLYIVDKTGWIKINSEKDIVALNGVQLVTADKLNSLIKRKDIKGMTPVADKQEKFAIYTR